MLLEHQAVVWKYRTHQIGNAVTWLQKTLERHVAEIMVAKLADFLLGDERRRRAYLAIVPDDEDFFAAQQRRQLRHVRLGSFVNDDEFNCAHFGRKLFRHAPSRHDPARHRAITSRHRVARGSPMHPRGFTGAFSDFCECMHELDQRRLDGRGKAPVELIESAFADDFPEQLPAPLLGRLSFRRKSYQFLPGINSRELRLRRRMVPCVAPRLGCLWILRHSDFVTQGFCPFRWAPPGNRACHIPYRAEVARKPFELREPFEQSVPNRLNLVSRYRRLSKKFIDDLLRQVGSAVTTLKNLQ